MKQFEGDGVDGNGSVRAVFVAGVVEQIGCGSLIVGRWFGHVLREADDEALPLEAGLEEGFVAADGAADGGAELLIADLLLFRAGGGKGVACGEGFVAVVVVSRAVDLVGSGLEEEIGDAAGIAASLRRTLGDKRELID